MPATSDIVFFVCKLKCPPYTGRSPGEASIMISVTFHNKQVGAEFSWEESNHPFGKLGKKSPRTSVVTHHSCEACSPPPKRRKES